MNQVTETDPALSSRPGDVYINMQRPTNTLNPVLSTTNQPDSFYR